MESGGATLAQNMQTDVALKHAFGLANIWWKKG